MRTDRQKEDKRSYGIAYRKTVPGLVTTIYGNQKLASKHRGHELPNYTKAELGIWMLRQPNFDALYINWVASGYKTELKPSCTRLDDYKPYTLDSMQLTTWGENKAKASADRVCGINNKVSIAVMQYTKSGEFVKEFYSACQASRESGIAQSHITTCCKGRIKSSGGFVWHYAGRES